MAIRRDNDSPLILIASGDENGDPNGILEYIGGYFRKRAVPMQIPRRSPSAFVVPNDFC